MAKVTSSEHPYIATIASRKESCHLNLPHRLGKLPRAVSPSGTLTAPEAGELSDLLSIKDLDVVSSSPESNNPALAEWKQVQTQQL